jgi:hypothetical protein
MCEIIRCFNEELRHFGEKNGDSIDMAQKLSKLYDKQVRIIVLLRQMNSTFEVSRFICKSK